MNFFTEIREGFGISWSAIRANKMRSILTTLGIVIGIVTVTLMGTAIEGVESILQPEQHLVASGRMCSSSWIAAPGSTTAKQMAQIATSSSVQTHRRHHGGWLLRMSSSVRR